MEPHSGLNSLDYIVIGIVLLSGLLALMRGFVREIFSLVAWVGAYFAAVRFYPLVTPWVHHYIKADKAAEWGAIALVYLVALIALMLIGFLITKLIIRGSAITAIDRSLGFLYGLLRGAVVVSLVYLGLVIILWPDIDKPPAEKTLEQQQQDAKQQDQNTPPDLLMQAKTRPLLAYGAKELKNIIPKDMIDKTLQGYSGQKKDAQKALDQQILDTLSTPAPPAHPVDTTTAPTTPQGTAP